MLGLYWLQMTATDQRITEAVNVTMKPVPPSYRPSDISTMLIGDEALSNRLERRYKMYKKAVEEKLRNDPMTYQVADASGLNETEKKRQKFRSHTDNLHGKIMNVLSESGGEYAADDFAATRFFNSLFRDYFFPGTMAVLNNNGNILVSLMNIGHTITVFAEASWFADHFMTAALESTVQVRQSKETWSDSIADLGKYLGTAGTAGVRDVSGSTVQAFTYEITSGPFTRAAWNMFKEILEWSKLLIIPGLFLAFYLPAMIMIQWLTQIVTWLIYLVEAVIVIPVWGVLFVGDMGQQALAPQSARQGFVHLLGILLYPTLMVIGFVIGLKIVDLISDFLIDFMEIGFLNATDGYMFGVVSMVAGVCIIGITAYQILLRIFSQMMELNQRAMSWIGQMPAYNDASAEQGVRSTFIGVNQTGSRKAEASDQGRQKRRQDAKDQLNGNNQ